VSQRCRVAVLIRAETDDDFAGSILQAALFATPTNPHPRNKPSWVKLVAASFFCGCLAYPTAASAFRPFDGTDASVAELGHLEIEAQPFGALQEGPVKTLVAPAAVFNYGFAPDWEAVLQGQIESEIAPTNHESLTANGAFLKYVVRPGVLQDQSGPSIATEFGAFLPNVGAPSAIKPSWTWIISQRFDWGTAHLNFALNEMSDPRTDLFLDMIIEGPSKWTIRPVVEIYSDSVPGGTQTFSGLIGAIWQVREDLAVDLAVRHAISGGHDTNEVRLGATISLPVDQPHPTPPDSAKAQHPAR
jgi:hypothetical protein